MTFVQERLALFYQRFAYFTREQKNQTKVLKIELILFFRLFTLKLSWCLLRINEYVSSLCMYFKAKQQI
jgi:hypothetical protein